MSPDPMDEWQERTDRKMGEADKVMNKCLGDRMKLRFWTNYKPGQYEQIFGKKTNIHINGDVSNKEKK